MGEYVTLVGSEQVQRAASQMQSAADAMNRAAGNLDHTMTMHQRFLDDWLMRFEQVLAQHRNALVGKETGDA